MRARNIKPGFFKNDALAELDPLCRVLFIGLWCLADREGRLKDRPKRIKAEVLPYDDCDVDAHLGALARAGFIKRYEVEGAGYIWIPGFLEHQTPHHKEIDSVLPAYEQAKLGSSMNQPQAKQGQPSPEKENKQPPTKTTQADKQDNPTQDQPKCDPSDSGFSDSGFSDSGFSDSGASGKHGGRSKNKSNKPTAKERREAMFDEIQTHFYPQNFNRHLAQAITGRRAYVRDLQQAKSLGFANEQALHTKVCIAIEQAKQSSTWQKDGGEGEGQFIPGIGTFFKERLWQGKFEANPPGMDQLGQAGRQTARNAKAALEAMEGGA